MYGIDLEADRELLRRKSWRWLEVRIIALTWGDTPLGRALTADREKQAAQ